jgi:hypothetical protein
MASPVAILDYKARTLHVPILDVLTRKTNRQVVLDEREEVGS